MSFRQCCIALVVLVVMALSITPAQDREITEIKMIEEKSSERSDFSFHYSSWGLNLIRKPVEKIVGGILEDNLKKELLEDIADDFPLARVTTYNQAINFNSGGSSFGFEARWYPGGRESSFSLGFSLEKTTMKIGFPVVSVHMEVESSAKPGTVGVVEARVENVNLKIEPISFHMIFCWDISPKWRIHPYFSLGLGFFSIRAFEEGRFQVTYDASLTIPDIKNKSWQDDIDKSVREFIDEKEESERKLPSILPVLQFHFGINGRITDWISLRVNAGFFDGFTLGAGLTCSL